MIRIVRLAGCFAVSAVVVQFTSAPLLAQQDSLALAGVHWREVGPYRGGRSVAATGNPSRPNEFWMGTTGGGVFKSINDGQSWAPVTDKYFGGTIGAIGVAASAPDVVYVGGGEYPIRGNVSHGDGVWKTTDGGKTWSFMGLGETRQIADIVVNPTNADLVYVGALGHVWAPNPERGVFRSKDGGKTWEKILFRNDSTGVVDLVMDPNNPNVLYAGLWQAGRTPWLLSSGGKGSGMFKTTDGGDHWTEITRNPGLPEGIWGNIGITVSGANSNRVWANIEADSGGVFRSDDAGADVDSAPTTIAICASARGTTPRSTPTPKDTNVVYVNNVSFMKSTDGGKTFRPVRGMSARRLARPVDRSQEQRTHDRVGRRRRGGERRRREDVVATRTSRPRSSITSSRRTTSRITSAARSRTTRRCAVRAGAASTYLSGSRPAAANPAGSRRAATIRTSSTPAATATCSRERICGRESR